jgi:hypothetical protein
VQSGILEQFRLIYVFGELNDRICKNVYKKVVENFISFPTM